MANGNTVKVDGFLYHLDEMSKDALMSLSEKLLLQMSDIREQIESAAARYNNEGKQSDSTWFISARKALRFKGSQHQLVLRAIKNANDRERAALIPFSNHFMNAAKEILPKDTYETIFNRAQTMTKTPSPTMPEQLPKG